MTHWTDEAAYASFLREIRHFHMPVHLLVGNHDDTRAFADAFLEALGDGNGFVQTYFETDSRRFVLLDTKSQKGHAGAHCAARRDRLARALDSTDAPLFLLLHRQPLQTGIAAMDRIMLQDVDLFYDVIEPHKARIRHLFFGHVNRAIFGNWRGINFSYMRGLSHQLSLDLDGSPDRIARNLETPAYGVVLLSEDQTNGHLHDFIDASNQFLL